jgi:hypothetical protein
MEVISTMSRLWQDDDELVTEMAEATGRAVLPDSVRRAAATAFAARRAAGAGLAKIRYDSLLDAFPVRGETPASRRIVTFEAESLSVEIETSGDQVVGQLVPPEPGQVEIMTLDGGSEQTDADSYGCFLLPRPAPGPVRFRCHTAAGTVFTDWIRLY